MLPWFDLPGTKLVFLVYGLPVPARTAHCASVPTFFVLGIEKSLRQHIKTKRIPAFRALTTYPATLLVWVHQPGWLIFSSSSSFFPFLKFHIAELPVYHWFFTPSVWFFFLIIQPCKNFLFQQDSRKGVYGDIESFDKFMEHCKT